MKLVLPYVNIESYKFCVEEALKEMRDCIEQSKRFCKSIETKSEGEESVSDVRNMLPNRKKSSLAELFRSVNRTSKK